MPGLGIDRLHAELEDQTAGEWLIRRGPSGLEWEHGHGRGDVAVRGCAMDLLLVLCRRATPERAGLEVVGDAALFSHWLEHSVF